MTLLKWLLQNVVRNWLVLTEGLAIAVGGYLGLFYEDGDVMGLRYLQRLQGSVKVLISLF